MYANIFREQWGGRGKGILLVNTHSKNAFSSVIFINIDQIETEKKRKLL